MADRGDRDTKPGNVIDLAAARKARAPRTIQVGLYLVHGRPVLAYSADDELRTAVMVPVVGDINPARAERLCQKFHDLLVECMDEEGS
jgi:hypothetical protein